MDISRMDTVTAATGAVQIRSRKTLRHRRILALPLGHARVHTGRESPNRPTEGATAETTIERSHDIDNADAPSA
jgi:hypothetical protein